MQKIEKAKETDAAKAIGSENKFFQIAFYDGEWYKGQDIYGIKSSRESGSVSLQMSELSEIYKERKQGSWIWIQDGGGKKLNVEDRESVFSRIWPNGKQSGHPETFSTCALLQKFFSSVPEKHNCGKEGTDSWKNASKPMSKVKAQSTGKWVDSEEFCGLANKRKWNINEDQRMNLKVYCSKPKFKD